MTTEKRTVQYLLRFALAARRLCALLVVLVAYNSAAASYTVSNTELNLGTITFPSSFSGTLLSTYSISDGYYDKITFVAGVGGSFKVSNAVTMEFGDTHTIKTIVYNASADISGYEILTLTGSGSGTVAFTKGKTYTIKVQMLSPSYYSTT